MPLAYMNAYPPTTSCRAASPTCRSRCSDGPATFTTQISKPAVNIASSTTGSISQRREPGSDTVSVTTLPQQFGSEPAHRDPGTSDGPAADRTRNAPGPADRRRIRPGAARTRLIARIGNAEQELG